MKILIVYSDIKCSCTRKGTFELKKGLSIFTLTDVIHYLELRETHFKNYNVIIFQRLGGNGVIIKESFYSFLEELIKKYKNKTYTSYFLDDLIINEGTIKMMSLVYKLLVPNPNYLKYVSKYNDNIFYTRTFLDLKEIESINHKPFCNNGLNLLWASTGGVGSSFMEELIPYLEEKIPNAIIHILGGASYRFKKFKNTIVYPILPYEDFIQYFKACDICLNPISIDTDYFRNVKMIDFINCKSELKYIISGAVKKPIISSKSEPYEYAIKNNINGFLLNNDKDIWIEHINVLSKNIKTKNKIISNAYSDVSKNYTIKSIGEKLYNLFKTFFENNTNANFDIATYSRPYYDIDMDQSESNSIVGEIFGNKKVFQSFKCNKKGLSKLDIRFATYMRENKGIIRVSLSSTFDGPSIRYQDIQSEKIYDNEWHTFSFTPIDDSLGKTFFIKIEGINCRIGSSVTVYYSSKQSSIGDLYINKTKFNGCLTFKSYSLNE